MSVAIMAKERQTVVDIRCRGCGKILFQLVVDKDNFSGVQSLKLLIKCSRCKYLNIITGR